MVELVRGVSFAVEAGRGRRPRRRVGFGQEPDRARDLRLLRRRSASSRARSGSTAGTSRSATSGRCASLRGGAISMVFQDALSGLNPAFTIGTQLIDVIVAHRRVGRAEASKIAVEALGMVGIPRAGAAAGAISAPVLRRNAPARPDRDGDCVPSQAADRGRADDCTRRDRAGADR